MSQGSRRAAPDKLKDIEAWAPDKIRTVTQLKGFLGLTQYYAIYMEKYAEHAAALTDALSDKGTDKSIRWNPRMVEALDAIKKGMLENVFLQIANPYKPFILRTDASGYAIGAVLSQLDSEGKERPVAFYSKKLQGKDGLGQRAWSVREQETYALVCALLKFRSWIGSSQVQVKAYVDHKSLESWYKEDLSTVSGPLGRRGRWPEFLSSFDIEVIYLPGPENVVADALSRWPYPAGLDQDCTFHGSLADERYHDPQEQRDRDYCEGHQGISSVRADNPSSSGAENYVYACCLHQEIDKKLQAIHRVSCRERDFSVACEVAGLESSASSDLNADEIQLFEPYSNPNTPPAEHHFVGL